MHLHSLCQTRLNLQTHTTSETEHRTSCLTTFSQTITVGSCQSDISNQCRIKTPSITGMAQTREGGGGVAQGLGRGGGGTKCAGLGKAQFGARKRGADSEMPLQSLVPNSQTVAQEEAKTVTGGGSLRWAFGWLRWFGGGFWGFLSVPGGF